MRIGDDAGNAGIFCDIGAVFAIGFADKIKTKDNALELEEINRIKNKKLICFDMDNTLVYSDRAHVEAFNKALDDLGLKNLAFMDIARHFGKPKEEVIKAISGSNDKYVINEINNIHDKYLYSETKKYSKKQLSLDLQETALRKVK